MYTLNTQLSPHLPTVNSFISLFCILSVFLSYSNGDVLYILLYMLLFSLNDISWRSFHIRALESFQYTKSHCMEADRVLPQNVILCECTIFYLMTTVPY